jgi:hypothetical protein
MAATRVCAEPTRLAIRGAIVIAKHPIWPTAFWERGLLAINKFGDFARVPPRVEQRKIEWQMRFFKITPVVGNQPIERQVDFADEKRLSGRG